MANEPFDDGNSTETALAVGENQPVIPQEADNSHSWSDLLPELVEHVYTFLSREDQCKMSMVCRRWSEEYNEPRFWRTIELKLPNSKYRSLSVYPEIAWAAKHGAAMRHVRINFQHFRRRQKGLVLRQLKLFLQNLSLNSQLESVSFLNSELFLERDLRKVVSTIGDFLSSQHKLKSVDFECCIFGNCHYQKILRIICEGNRETLQNLGLKELFDEPPDSDFRFFYKALLNLRTLGINYCETYESILIGFSRILEQKRKENGSLQNILLESIRVSCEEIYTEALQGIPPETWLAVKEACPNLGVDITYKPGMNAHTYLMLYFRRHMPLRTLEITAEDLCSSNHLNSERFFEHLTYCEFNKTLQELSFVWQQRVTNFAPAFAKFSKICKKLKRVRINVRNPIPNLCTLFETWAQSRPPALEAAHITVMNVLTTEEYDHFMYLAEYYGPTLENLGIKLDLIVDTRSEYDLYDE